MARHGAAAGMRMEFLVRYVYDVLESEETVTQGKEQIQRVVKHRATSRESTGETGVYES